MQRRQSVRFWSSIRTFGLGGKAMKQGASPSASAASRAYAAPAGAPAVELRPTGGEISHVLYDRWHWDALRADAAHERVVDVHVDDKLVGDPPSLAVRSTHTAHSRQR